MRGTESGGGQTWIDLLKADLKEIGFYGLALSQAVSMVNFVLRLQAPQSATSVMQFDLRTSTSIGTPALGATVIGAPMGQPGAWFWLEPRTNGRGLGAIPPGTSIDVTGHSLGGHLAGLATRLFPSLVSDAVIFNAPGYDPITADLVRLASSPTPLAAMLDLLSPAMQLTDESMAMFGRYLPVSSQFRNVSSFEAEDLATGDDADLISGLLTGLPFGPEADVSVEMVSHGMGQIVDSLALQSLMSKLDPTLKLGSFEAMFRAGSKMNPKTLEELIVGLERLVVDPTAQANLPTAEAGYVSSGEFSARSAWYARWKIIEEAVRSGNAKGLASQVRFEATHDAGAARKDFAALLSLTTGATFSLRLNDPSPSSAASMALSAQHAAVYQEWLADRNLTSEQRRQGKENFTDSYLRDRAGMLNTLAQANTNDKDFVNVVGGGESVFSEDKASTTVVLAQAGTSMRFVTFGGNSAEQFTGSGLSDHLYGGAGNDTIKADKGADWLEGNAGNDSLEGGAGADNDTLWGGAGDDTLKGEEGSDFLKGGDGNDTYTFAGKWGSDTLDDSDGQGGQLGIGLGSDVAPPAAQPSVFYGDFIKKENEYGAYVGGGAGNYVSNGAQPNAQDMIQGPGAVWRRQRCGRPGGARALAR